MQAARARGEHLAVRVGKFILGWAMRVIAFMVEFVTPSNSTVRSRWLRAPSLDQGAEVCIFVSYAPGSVMPEYSRFHARAWAEAGFHVIIVLNTDLFGDDTRMDDLDFASGVLVRENRGYDFGAWASALQALPTVKTASLVALVNDSIYGPLNTFGQMLERAREVDCDVIGAVESLEFGRHFQSFLLLFRPRALHSDAFWDFWRKVRAGGRLIAVYRYELRLLSALERAGLRCDALFRSSDTRNPTLTKWRQLIDQGLPYVKVALLRDNTFKSDLSGWQEVLEKHGYDPALATQPIAR
jgi:hypothetical protein